MDLPHHGYHLVLRQEQTCSELSPPQQEMGGGYRLYVFKVVRFSYPGLSSGEAVLGLLYQIYLHSKSSFTTYKL